MPSSVRTRFAPSPTGTLHVGNLRIAAFNHLFARGRGGAFVLRVEDTDRDRNVPGALEAILEDLRWSGLEWDEGPDRGGPFGPYLQSERADRHRDRALALEERGVAYRCFCSDDVIEAARTDLRESPACPGGCRSLLPREVASRIEVGEPSALRFAVPDGEVHFIDEVRGDISLHGRDIGDFVILRSDDRSTYNFAVVVDDVDMAITHVIRGAGHLSNTPKQALLFDALEAPRPVFAHLPTVLGPDGTRLSKRTGAPGVHRLREEGYHPDAVVNYLSLLGWSPGDDREVLSPDELARAMDLGRAGASNTVYDPEKLRWMSAQHIARMTLEELAVAVSPHVDRERFSLGDEELPPILEALRTRLHTFSEINLHLPLLFPSPEVLGEAHVELATEGNGALEVLTGVRDALAALEAWSGDRADTSVRDVGRGLGARGPALFHPVRLALCGARSGPDLGSVIVALGRERTLARLDAAIAGIREGEGPDASGPGPVGGEQV